MGSLTAIAGSIATRPGASGRICAPHRPPVKRRVTIVGGGPPVQRLVRLILSEIDVGSSIADSLDETLFASDLVVYCCAGLEPRRLAGERRRTRAPLIALTTDDREDLRLETLALGVDAVVLMPFDPEHLAGLASYLLRRRAEMRRSPAL